MCKPEELNGPVSYLTPGGWEQVPHRTLLVYLQDSSFWKKTALGRYVLAWIGMSTKFRE